MESHQAKSDYLPERVIKLNIGGCHFSTTSGTLLKAPEGTQLNLIGQGLFSSSDGPIFIDRDPMHFRIILNFLRDGARLALPIEPQHRHELLVEATYYKLTSLCELLSQVPLSLAITLPANENALWEIAKLESAASLRSTNPQERKISSSCIKDLSTSSKPQQTLCYMCKCSIPSEFLLCDICSGLNSRKRLQSADLRNWVAIVTGARIKIGFATALKLLRCGAMIIATTRFPYDAANRFAQEADFSSFSSRLHIYGLDLRKFSEIESFVNHIRQRYRRVDVLINNAAQTIRYPPAFYRSAVETEQRLFAANPNGQNVVVKTVGMDPFCASEAFAEKRETATAVTVHVDANQLLSLASLLPGESLRDDTLFPPGQVDSHGQQLDLRTHNSWIETIDDVSPLELVEVQMVNAIAPFILISQLLALFSASPLSARFIVNVSSAEGQFHGYKAQHHPHTNMAKAALNMLTRTAGPTLAKKCIYMNAIDTGWVSKLGPVPSQVESRKIPLTTEDGAARVLDPIFSALLDPLHQPTSGVFFKHFVPAPW